MVEDGDYQHVKQATGERRNAEEAKGIYMHCL